MGRRRALGSAAVVLLAVLTTGCTSSGSAREPRAGTTSTTSTTAPATGREVAIGLGDVDGDRRPDDVYLVGGTSPRLGVHTAAGRESEVAAPVNIITAVLGLADVNGDGALDVWVAGFGNTLHPEQVQVATLQGGRLALIAGPDRQPYTFPVQPEFDGARAGLGVGCVNVGGDRTLELVRLESTSSGEEVRWTRTEVRVRGSDAREGRVDHGTFVRGRDDEAISLLTAATCGDVVLRGFGLPRVGDGEGAAG